ncbi:MAG: response regulator [Proteobacteria bacterium]|nr:response regulator [Pseudomonadota bacterium]
MLQIAKDVHFLITSIIRITKRKIKALQIMVSHVRTKKRSSIDPGCVSINVQKRVLVVEDTATWTQMLTYTLINELKVTVIAADSLEKAVQLLEQYEFDAAVTDLCLPDAANGEVVKHLLEKQIPTWVLTGSLDAKVKKLFLDRPIVDYVVKEGSFCLDYIATSIKRFWENKKKTVLIVDDSRSFRASLSAILETQNFNVITAVDGVSALRKMEENTGVSLVLTDYEMPNMNGIDLCRELRRKYHKDKLAIIALSATESDVSAHFIKSGANDFLGKPYSKEELICRVNQNIDAIDRIEKIRLMIDTDFLTGINNRRSCFTTGAEIWNDNIAKNGFSVAVMIDIDYFKNINDTYGHDIGDEVIKLLANRIKHCSDKFNAAGYRLGGEEFAMILPISFEGSLAAIEELRQEIESTVLTVNDKEIKFTISVGIHVDSSGELDEGLKYADNNLYESKRSGRNRITHTGWL